MAKRKLITNLATNKEFVDKLAQDFQLTKKDAKFITTAFIDTVKKMLLDGKDVRFNEFGRFGLKMQKARKNYDFASKKVVKIKKCIAPTFHYSDGFRKNIKEQY